MNLQVGETYASQERVDASGDINQYEERRVNQVTELMQVAEPVRKSQEARWQQGYEYYYNMERQFRLKQKHQSKIFVPRTFQVIETKTPQIAMSILQQSPIFTVNPESTATVEQAKICEGLLSWQMHQMKNTALNLTLLIKDSCLYGGSIAKTGWSYKETMMPERQVLPPVLDFASKSIIQDQKIIQVPLIEEDGPVFTNCDIGEIYPDPAASCIEDAKYIIHRMVKPLHEIQQLGKMGFYKNTEKIEQHGAVQHWVGDFANRRFSTANINDPYQMNSNIYSYVEIIECWWVDPTDPLTRKWKTTIANRRTLLQDVPLTNIFWHNRFPFKLLKNIPMTKEFWGISECDVIQDMQREINSLRNQRMDNVNSLNKGFVLANRNAGINEDKLRKIEPGGILWTNDINGVRVERPPSVDNVTAYSEQAADRDIQMATGQSDVITGTSTRSQFRNATTANIIEQAAKTRLGLAALLAVEQIRGIAEDFVALDYQYLNPATVVSIMGADGKNYKANITPDMIPRNPDVYATLGAEIQGNADVKKQMLLQLTELLQQVPGFNQTDWMRDLAKDFGKKDIDKYFIGPDWVVPIEQVMGEMGLGDSRPGVSNYKPPAAVPDQPNQHSEGGGEVGGNYAGL